MDEKIKKSKTIGYLYLFFFVILISGGIITKRVYGHPEYMMLWHLPGAVFLVLGGKKLTYFNRMKYYKKNNNK